MKIELNFGHYVLSLVLLIGAFPISISDASEIKSSKISNQVCAVELRELMASLAGKKEKTARFKEEKFLGVLAKPLKTEGTLRFRAPDYLEKIITKPQQERLVVENDIVRIFDQQDDSRTLSLEDYPPLKDLLNGIRFTLLGDLDALTKYYETDLTGDCHLWSLVLLPKSASAMSIIERIIILGKKDTIDKFTLVESNGDFTTMTIEKGLP
jgi:outer membrane lipoprotein-sorting protein